MAVHAHQYPPNLLLLSDDRANQLESTKPTDFSHPAPLFFSTANNGSGSTSSWNREREATAAAAPAMIGSSTSTVVQCLQPPAPQRPPLVSTGLRLSVNENQPSSIFSGDFAAQISQHYRDIDNFLQTENEQLRRALAERRQRQHRALLSAAEETAARRLREKETELDQATRRAAELEDRLARLQSESIAWQTKALADQAAASALHAQIQQQSAVPTVQRPVDDDCFEPTGEDAESAYIDPCRDERVRSTHRNALCRACGVRQVSAVLLPCRHLCLCAACDTAVAAQICPVCRCPRSRSVIVFLS